MSTKENEADEDALLYETRYIPNTVKLDWQSDVPGLPEGPHPLRMGTLTTPGDLEP